MIRCCINESQNYVIFPEIRCRIKMSHHLESYKAIASSTFNIHSWFTCLQNAKPQFIAAGYNRQDSSPPADLLSIACYTVVVQILQHCLQHSSRFNHSCYRVQHHWPCFASSHESTATRSGLRFILSLGSSKTCLNFPLGRSRPNISNNTH